MGEADTWNGTAAAVISGMLVMVIVIGALYLAWNYQNYQNEVNSMELTSSQEQVVSKLANAEPGSILEFSDGDYMFVRNNPRIINDGLWIEYGPDWLANESGTYRKHAKDIAQDLSHVYNMTDKGYNQAAGNLARSRFSH